MKNLLKKWWFWVIVVIIILINVTNLKDNDDNKDIFYEIDQLIVANDLEKALTKAEEYIENHFNDKDGYLKYAEICEKKGDFSKGIIKIMSGKIYFTSSDKQILEEKENELRNKEKELRDKEKEELKNKEKEEKSNEAENIQSVDEEIEKERFNNCDNILSQLYPYGHTLKMLDWKKVSETTDGITVYTGYVKIKNAFGNKATYQIGVIFNEENNVQKINVNNEEVYKK